MPTRRRRHAQYKNATPTPQSVPFDSMDHEEFDQKPVALEPAPDQQQPSNAEIGAQNITTTSLNDLQSKDSRKLMDMVDRLRRSGLSGVVQLPQLVVSGDQSSGKSSVLEAITEIQFPRKENLCTRFATEIILRRAATASISTKIIPDKVRPSTEKKKLEAFKSTIVDFSELPDLIEEATNLMGLGDDGSGTARAFSRDVLSIEIAGPGRPHLTLVDLPGLIHSENKMQSKEDVELIKGLVDDYIKEKRTIIMAVVSAKNDYANQIILKKCRDVDPKGHRTLGIITKPDFLEPGSENETSWLELAQNKDIFFELGWHMLKNRSDKESKTSCKERNAAEVAFFARRRYRDLPDAMMGIASLRTRLSQLLYKHLKTELPALQKELDGKFRDVCSELALLGEKRSSLQEQRRYLMTISTAYQDIVKAAVDGHYENPFFGDLYTDRAVNHASNNRRLRAVVQYLNLQFASAMRRYGHRSRIVEDTDETAESDSDHEGSQAATRNNSVAGLDEGYARFADYQEDVTRAAAIQRVRQVLERSRGRELPGTFNPMLISQLFWEQSEHWKQIAGYHVENVANVCANFVSTAVASAASEDVVDRLQSLKVNVSLEKRLAEAKRGLERIIKDTRGHPITYDPAYTTLVQEMRDDKYSARINSLVGAGQATDEHGVDWIKTSQVKISMKDLLESDMDKISAEEALDSQHAYYKEEVNYFISAITKQVVERHLMEDLAEDTISPTLIVEMSDEEVAYIAAEPEETVRIRDNLEARKATLEKGQQTFRSALGFFK